MKSYLKYRKVAFSTFIAASALVACSDFEEPAAVSTTPYNANTSNLKTAGKAVDLGLSVKWADMNVGAASATDNGLLFSWGDITGTSLEEGTYSVMLSQTEVSEMYAKYKGDQKTESKFDTVTINYAINSEELTEPVLVTSSFKYMEVDSAKLKAEIEADTVKDAPNHPYQDQIFADKLACSQKKLAAVETLINNKIDYVVKNYKYTGLLEARLTAGEFDYTINFDGTVRTNRTPVAAAEVKKAEDGSVDAGKTAEDLLRAQKDSIAYAEKIKDEAVSIIFYAINKSEVSFFESKENPKYEEIKDQYGAVQYKRYMGNDYDNITVYNMAGNAKCDAATANWGAAWRIPTNEEIKELVDKCTWEFEGNGYKVTGPNGNSIFLPAAGYRYGNEVVGAGNAGYYASLGTAKGSYHYPSTNEQLAGSEGSVKAENKKNYLIFNYGQFDKSINLYNNITTNYASSIRPVCN